MGIEHQVPHATTPIVPRGNASKSIVEGDGDIAVLEVAPAVHVELANSVHANRGTHGFVEKLDCRDSRVASHVVADLVEGGNCSANRVTLTPASASSLTRVVEAVLRVGSYVFCQSML